MILRKGWRSSEKRWGSPNRAPRFEFSPCDVVWLETRDELGCVIKNSRDLVNLFLSLKIFPYSLPPLPSWNQPQVLMHIGQVTDLSLTPQSLLWILSCLQTESLSLSAITALEPTDSEWFFFFLTHQEEKAKAYKKEKQKEKKRRAEEDLTFEEEDEMAAVMGFSGFGSTKKSYWSVLCGLTLAFTGPNFECVLRWGGGVISFLGTGEGP